MRAECKVSRDLGIIARWLTHIFYLLRGWLFVFAHDCSMAMDMPMHGLIHDFNDSARLASLLSDATGPHYTAEWFRRSCRFDCGFRAI